MIEYEKFILDNGLTVIFHPDKASNIAVVNLLYKVGARDELPYKTGLAHLLEHLMFEGSVNIPNFDKPLERAGGESNAFTNSDYTNYYCVIPKHNLETVLWLESDRMLSLDFNKEKFEIQKKVVIEEFKETVLNQPYGDDYKYLLKLSYKVHPYKWAVIGEDISHIESFSLDDVKDFFFKNYAPNNAILSIAGDFEIDYIKEIVHKWFGDIPSRKLAVRSYPVEPQQIRQRYRIVKRKVPYDKILLGFHAFARKEFGYYVSDVITDLLSEGSSSRLYQSLVKEKKLFSDIDAYITGKLDLGLVIIEGIVKEGKSFDKAIDAIWEELNKISNEIISDYEYEKIKNNIEADFQYNKISLLTRTMSLAFYEMLRDASLYNLELNRYNSITKEDILLYSNLMFKPYKANIVYYLREE